MKTKLFATNPDDMDFTVEITMPLKKWKALREQIPAGAWPSTDLRAAIVGVILKAEKHFEPESPTKDTE